MFIIKQGIHILLFSCLFFLIGFSSCKDCSSKETGKKGITDTVGLLSRELGHFDNDSLLTALYRLNNAKFGDFDSLFARRFIRVLIPYSRTLFFHDKGRERGISAEIFRDFEFYLNKKYKRKRKNIPITILIIPTQRDKLLKNLNAGLGDIAAGNITVTEERLKQVDFFSSDRTQPLFEIPITHKMDDSLSTVDQLSGRTIHVRRSSSYYEHLMLLSKDFKDRHKAPMKIICVSEDLEDEDLMEMLDAGILSTIIVNRWKSRMWSAILPNLRLNERSAIHSNGRMGWAVRKKSPKLISELSDFYFKYEERNGVIPYRLKKYAAQVKHLQDPTGEKNNPRFKQIMQLFEKYGKKYDFDPLMLTALGFQESKLNQNTRSHVGAVGVMQLMPKTGASMRVGSIYVTENNIHAGTKYINILMHDYFQDAHFDQFNRSLFAFASYNAGPNKVAKLRRIAIARKLNPDVWLNNVEVIASEVIGQETTTYVRNIIKYYYAYKMMQGVAAVAGEK